MAEQLTGYVLVHPPEGASQRRWRHSLREWWRPCARYPEFVRGEGSQLWRASLDGVTFDPGFDLHPEPLRCRGYTLLERMPDWLRYGPRGEEVATLVEWARTLSAADARRLADEDVIDLNSEGDDPRLRMATAEAAHQLRRVFQAHDTWSQHYPDGSVLRPPWDAALVALQRQARAIIWRSARPIDTP